MKYINKKFPDNSVITLSDGTLKLMPLDIPFSENYLNNTDWNLDVYSVKITDFIKSYIVIECRTLQQYDIITSLCEKHNIKIKKRNSITNDCISARTIYLYVNLYNELEWGICRDTFNRSYFYTHASIFIKNNTDFNYTMINNTIHVNDKTFTVGENFESIYWKDTKTIKFFFCRKDELIVTFHNDDTEYNFRELYSFLVKKDDFKLICLDGVVTDKNQTIYIVDENYNVLPHIAGNLKSTSCYIDKTKALECVEDNNKKYSKNDIRMMGDLDGIYYRIHKNKLC
jgi:hypothetical protein